MLYPQQNDRRNLLGRRLRANAAHADGQPVAVVGRVAVADTVAGLHADPPEMWSEEYQAELLRLYLDVADKKTFVVGAHVWNFADFRTPQSIRRVGGHNLKGVFTRDRRPKLAAHQLRERWQRQR